MPRISLLVLVLLFKYPVSGQESLSSTNLNDRMDYKTLISYQADYLHNFYFQNVDNIDELVNGKEYIPYYFRSKFKPLLYFDRRHKSSLTLNGRRYDNLMLEYDTYKDELIYTDSLKLIDNKVFILSLNEDPVDAFIFYFGTDSMYFKYFSRETNLNFNLSDGFFEVGYDGISKFIIKHRSAPLVKEGIEEYVYSPALYVKVGKDYTRITGKKVFLSLFGDKSDELKKFIQVNKVHIRKANKYEIAAVLRYYDSLNLTNR